MSKTIMNTINEQLNEEKWTRLTISNYTITNYTELDKILVKIFDAQMEDEVMERCKDHLSHSKNSSIALYLSGIINLSHQSIDDSNLLLLINLFSENHRWNIVEHLSRRILDFGENRHALRTLADCYKHEGDTQRLYETWERLIRVDYEEAEVVLKLAAYEEEKENSEMAVSYYKKALHRYINKKLFTQVRTVWLKLMELIPNETEFFYHAESRVSKIISEERAVELLEEQYPYFKNKEKWTIAIRILKRIIVCNSKNPWARKEIVECYRAMYASHSHLEEYIKLSNLSQSWRNIHDAIQDFEKHIAFDAGNFVYHRSWGVGRIKALQDDNVVINFRKKKDHTMSLKMGVSSLQTLGREHIWVYRITKKKEALNAKIRKDPLWALKTVIKSFDNAANMKKIKAELVPSILTPSEWIGWSSKARDLLKTDESFGNLPDNPDTYVVRDQPMSLEEKTYNRFKAEKDFFDRVKTLQEFLEYAVNKEESIESDLFRDMFDYFVGYVRNVSTYNEQTISAMLIVLQVTEQFSFLNPGVGLVFKDFFDKLENYEETFQKINNLGLRKFFLQCVRRQIKDWPKVFVDIFPHHLHKELIRELLSANYKEMVVQKFLELYNSYRNIREPYIWFVRNCWDDDWFSETNISQEKILITMIHLWELTTRDVENKRDVVLNRKLAKQIYALLVKDQQIIAYLNKSNIEDIGRVYALIEDVRDIDPGVMAVLRKTIAERFPDFEFFGDTDTVLETVSRSGFLALMKSYEERQRILKYLHDVEVPKNSKEIAVAREFGDLKENAEYKAAKERQDILNTTARKWEEELQSVQVVLPENVNPDKVSFGTVTTLLNLVSMETEKITIMGPWESNPDKKILSHLSPFASQLLNSVVGQKLEFTINQRDYRYEVKDISLVNFEEIETVQVSI